MIKGVGNILILLSAALFSACEQSGGSDPGNQDEIEMLLSRMSLREKAGQMTNLSLMALAEGDFWMKRDTVVLDTAKLRVLLKEKGVGSVQNLGSYPFSVEEWNLQIKSLQEYVMENTDLQIPILYGIDAVHGANYSAKSTLFPHQLALASTRNRALAEETGRITSYEMMACNIPWNYAPVLDVSKQPVWGRIFETFGEDTYITSQMGAAYIQGSQGKDLSDPYTTAVCLKHFIGYGTPFNGKDRSPAVIPEHTLREVYIPPFEKAIEEGALTIMINSGSVNGIPSHADHKLITEILKGELGFEGFTISDWEDVVNLYKTHQVARDEREAVKISVNAGLDMCMEPYDASFADHLVNLVDSGEVSLERVNDAVRRILKVKKKLGLFEQLEYDADYSLYGSEEHAGKAYEAAVESVILLKNEKSILPLDLNKKYLITGVGANSLNYLNGAWSRSWSGRTTEYNDEEKYTILEAIEEMVGNSNITFVEGTGYDEDINTSKAVSAASQADVIIACLGEIPATEKPSDIDDLTFPKAQLNLVKELSKTGKPIVLVILEARPRIIRPIEPLADGICVSFLPGHEGGKAIADILFGKQNPSGKLPVTYPRYPNSIWTYDHTKADKRDAGFGFDGFQPQYEFGHGLSYSSFKYSDLGLSHDTLNQDDTLTITVNLTNTGKRVGKEAVELYSSDMVASIVPAVKRLRGFEKYELQPGETKNIVFRIKPSDLAFVNHQNKWITEPGEFIMQIDTLQKKLFLNE